MDDERDERVSAVEVELRGLSVYTHHGVTEAEREVGQRLEIDVSFDVPDCDAVLTDRLEDTVDYAEATDIVVLAATERSYKTLERISQVIAERLAERFGSGAVRVRAAKPEPPLPVAIEEAAVEVTHERVPAADDDDDPEPPTGAERTGYLGLGSNVGDRDAHLRAALALLADHGVAVEAASSTYETEPVGEILDQPAFLNAVARVRTGLEPLELLDLCKAIEIERGRVLAGPRHGPRPLDVDLLLLGEVELESERLTLPHPEVTSRRFVLVPLLELDPELALPDGTRVADALDALGDSERVERAGSLR